MVFVLFLAANSLYRSATGSSLLNEHAKEALPVKF